MGCGASASVPCATVKTVPYKPLKRGAEDDSGSDPEGLWSPSQVV